MRIVLADSNDLTRVGLRSILQTNDAIEIVGEARSNQELLETLSAFEIDCLVIDYTASGFNIDILGNVKTTFPECEYYGNHATTISTNACGCHSIWSIELCQKRLLYSRDTRCCARNLQWKQILLWSNLREDSTGKFKD